MANILYIYGFSIYCKRYRRRAKLTEYPISLLHKDVFSYNFLHNFDKKKKVKLTVLNKPQLINFIDNGNMKITFLIDIILSTKFEFN